MSKPLPLALLLLASTLLRAADTVVESPLTEADREHWAFQPLRRASPPPAPANESRTPVDAFLLARLAELSPPLGFAPEADRAALLRRLSFDLTGLPPTPDAVTEFVRDESPDAYERCVDRLLASPAYGERWGQHWLDLARFAETDGFEHDKLRTTAWKYRDWVLAALNADLPYDEFVRRQIAGDELPESGGEIATMFCLAGPDMMDLNDQVERRHIRLNELTAAVGSVFLGLQLGCCQCHDHKYDPLSQADFYRLRAVFESAVPPLQRDVPCLTLKRQPNTPPARLWIRGDHRRPGPLMPAGFPRIASVATSRPPESPSRMSLAQWLVGDDNRLTARVIVNRVWQHHFGRGLFDSPSDAGLMGAGPSHPELLDWLAWDLRDHGWSLKHLHRTIVCSAAYRQASRATHDADWQRRRELDPPNRLLSRFPRRRLEGEALRDAMLAVSGLMSVEVGGPGVMPPLPEELVSTLLKNQWTTTPREADHYRRSVYLFARRNLRFPILDAFDRPDANASCPARNRSTTAPQSLLQFNSEFTLLAARHLAGRIAASSADTSEQVRRLYSVAFSRLPTDRESETLVTFLRQQRERLADEGRPRDRLALPARELRGDDPYSAAALVDACLAILNANEFLYLD